jgi:PilZ domain-containing protein
VNVKDARRTDRVSLHLPIRVSGTDVTGQDFDEPARTVSISRYGATIVLARKLAPGQRTTIRNLSTRTVAKVRVVGQIGGQLHAYVYCIALVDSTQDIWKIRFPPLSESGEAVSRLLLECAICQTREVTYLNELEVEVFEANANLSRSCQNCHDWTVWKQALLETTPNQVAGAGEQPLASSSSSDPRTRNRRKSVRVRLKKITACIRQPGFEEEIVNVDDLSSGGLRFRSAKNYHEGSRIEVAVPYEARGANIFVLARIVRLRELLEANFKEYGAMYIKP